MRRNRRFLALLCLLLPVALWALSGWSQPPAGISLQASGSSSSPATPPDPIIQAIIDQVTEAEFIDIDGGLSGAHPVTVGGNSVTFTTRYSPSAQGTLAEQYVYEYFQSLGLATSYHNYTYCGFSARNVVAEIPCTLDPARHYLITAHLDTISPQPTTNAKGADDDGSGTTAVMMAARILRSYTFDYTLKFIAFTGEERGLCGSNRYATDARNRNDDIRGVINLDMIAYDSNNVNDVEIHSGTRADSNAFADIFIANITTYGLDLVPYRYTSNATTASDHASFWSRQYPAFLGIERYQGGDFNPWYHSYTCCDDMSHLDVGMAVAYTKASLATLAQVAVVHPTGGTPTPPTATNTPVPPTSTPTVCAAPWIQVTGPDVPKSGRSALNSVAVAAPDDIWAVGYYALAGSSSAKPLIIRWNGSEWITVSLPGSVNFTYGALYGVTAISADDVWTVGSGGRSLHWDGTTWTNVPVPRRWNNFSYYLTDVAGSASNDVWAVGRREDTIDSYMVLVHWNGSKWSEVPIGRDDPDSPNKDWNRLSGVAVVGPNDAWVIGESGDLADPRTFTAHWDGIMWRYVPSPNVGSGRHYMKDIVAIGTDDVWAVGYYWAYGQPSRTVTMHWDGAEWSIVPSPNVGTSANVLFGVSGTTSNDVWAVGYANNSGNAYYPLILDWDGSQWSSVDGPALVTSSNQLLGIVAAAGVGAWSVGTAGSPESALILRTSGEGGACPTHTPTATPVPPSPTDTPVPQPTDTPAPPTNTPPATPTVPACVVTFTDVHPSDYFYEAVRYLVCYGVVSGYADNTFRPYNSLTRAQAVKMVVLGYGWSLVQPQQPTFTDVPSSHWAYAFVETAYDHDVISGYDDNTFRPNNELTRSQLAKVVVLAAEWQLVDPVEPTFTDVPRGSTFYPFVETAYSHNIISGYSDRTFRPYNNMTRGQFAKVLFEAVQQ